MNPLSKISIRDKFESFDQTWSPKILTRVDDFAIKIVKLEGEFVWHRHADADADEVFLVIAGEICMKYRLADGEHEVVFGPGELLRIPRGVEHLPIAAPRTEIMLFERADVVNTGDAASDRKALAVEI